MQKKFPTTISPIVVSTDKPGQKKKLLIHKGRMGFREDDYCSLCWCPEWLLLSITYKITSLTFLKKLNALEMYNYRQLHLKYRLAT